MIGFLRGKVICRQGSCVVLETGGVGYELQVSKTAAEALALNSLASFWVCAFVRQDSLELFGFERPEEKRFFLCLLKVNRIGPKMALNLLGSCSLEQLARMIREGDTKALGVLPGVGKKMAQQIALTLKDQISENFAETQGEDRHSGKVAKALESLGFAAGEIREALARVSWTQDLEKDIKQALSSLNSSNFGPLGSGAAAGEAAGAAEQKRRSP